MAPDDCSLREHGASLGAGRWQLFYQVQSFDYGERQPSNVDVVVSTASAMPAGLGSLRKMPGVQRWQDVRILGDAMPLWFPACRAQQLSVRFVLGIPLGFSCEKVA
jgi:hypothetical protein